MMCLGRCLWCCRRHTLHARDTAHLSANHRNTSHLNRPRGGKRLSAMARKMSAIIIVRKNGSIRGGGGGGGAVVEGVQKEDVKDVVLTSDGVGSNNPMCEIV